MGLILPIRIERFAEGVIEAGWLGIAAVAPLYYNVFSAYPFEPSKQVMVRSITLIMIAVWLLKILSGGRPWRPVDRTVEQVSRDNNLWRQRILAPLMLPILIFCASHLLSAVFSLTPRISWWGSTEFLQGSFSILGSVAVFLLALAHLRTREQWRRLAFVFILTSLAVCFHGLLQFCGFDIQVTHRSWMSHRIASFPGNPIYLAAYLIFPVFIALYFLRESLVNRGACCAARRIGWSLILCLQLLVIVLTGSRGPALALLVGLWIFAQIELLRLKNWAGQADGLSRTVYAAARWVWLIPPVLAGCALVYFFVANADGSRGQEMNQTARWERIAGAFDLESDSARGRVAIWGKGLEFMWSGAHVRSVDGDIDGFHGMRPFIGYGPETQNLIFQQHFPAQLAAIEAPGAIPYRSHNESLDALLTGGLTGLIAFWGLWAAIFSRGLEWLGLIRGVRQRRMFWVTQLVTIGAGALIPWSLSLDPALLCLGMPMGLILGVVLWIMKCTLTRNQHGFHEGEAQQIRLLTALFSCLAAYFVELQFAFAVAATSTSFWVLLAVFVAAGTGWLRQSERYRLATGVEGSDRSTVFAYLASIVLITVVFSLLDNWRVSKTCWDVMTGFFALRMADGAGLGVLILFVWLAGAAAYLFLYEGSARELARFVGASAGSLSLAVLVQSWWLAAAARHYGEGDYLACTSRLSGLTLVQLGMVLILMTGFGLANAAGQAGGRSIRGHSLPLLVGGFAVMAACLLGVGACLRVIRADTLLRHSVVLDHPSQQYNKLFLLDRAVRLRPKQDWYLVRRAEALVLSGRHIPRRHRNRVFERAAQDLGEAITLNPFNLSHLVTLGRTRLTQARVEQDSHQREHFLKDALTVFERVVELSPDVALLHLQYGFTLQHLGWEERALDAYHHALILDPGLKEGKRLIAELLAGQGANKGVFRAGTTYPTLANLALIAPQSSNFETVGYVVPALQ